MLKFKVGDKVVLTEKGREMWAGAGPDFVMNQPDTVLVVALIRKGNDPHPYLIETIGDVFQDEWVSESELEHYVGSMEDD